MKTRKQIERERDELHQRISDLNKEEQSIETDPVREVANAIHSAFCKDKHDDNCNYYYDSWDNSSGARQRHVKKAIALLKVTEKNKILEIIDILSK